MKNIPIKEKEVVAEKLKEALLDENKMQELAAELNQKRHSKSANTME